MPATMPSMRRRMRYLCGSVACAGQVEGQSVDGVTVHHIGEARSERYVRVRPHGFSLRLSNFHRLGRIHHIWGISNSSILDIVSWRAWDGMPCPPLYLYSAGQAG